VEALLLRHIYGKDYKIKMINKRVTPSAAVKINLTTPKKQQLKPILV